MCLGQRSLLQQLLLFLNISFYFLDKFVIYFELHIVWNPRKYCLEDTVVSYLRNDSKPESFWTCLISNLAASNFVGFIHTNHSCHFVRRNHHIKLIRGAFCCLAVPGYGQHRTRCQQGPTPCQHKGALGRKMLEDTEEKPEANAETVIFI